MLEAILGRRRSSRNEPRQPFLSFGSWSELPEGIPKVLQVCHPDWRGVKTVAYAFQTPVVECDDLAYWGAQLAGEISKAGTDLVVIQGWPPGSANFVDALAAHDVSVATVLHSSPAQHGAEIGEALVVKEVLDLLDSGALARVGIAKAGVAEAFRRSGRDVRYVPNRTPVLPELDLVDLGKGLHVGLFAEPFWRKNLITQLLAVSMLEGAVAHVMTRPDGFYLDDVEIVEHGELPWPAFVSLQGSVDLNLYVTLSECHPSTPQESYLAGVPCLTSRVSAVFRSNAELWALTSVDEADNPHSIKTAAERLLANHSRAVDLATGWMATADLEGKRVWADFVDG